MKLIIGLGNPGKIYKNTRHNIGFLTIDRLARGCGAEIKKEKYHCLFCEARVDEEKLILAKPLTFMNLSGMAVRELARRYKAAPEDILVVCDDVNLEYGLLRIRARGSAGGHHGLLSIIDSLGTSDFPRLRIGVGGGGRKELSDYVLGNFYKTQAKELGGVLERACEAIDIWVKEGLAKAMNKSNIRRRQEDE